MGMPTARMGRRTRIHQPAGRSVKRRLLQALIRHVITEIRGHMPQPKPEHASFADHILNSPDPKAALEKLFDELRDAIDDKIKDLERQYRSLEQLSKMLDRDTGTERSDEDGADEDEDYDEENDDEDDDEGDQ